MARLGRPHAPHHSGKEPPCPAVCGGYRSIRLAVSQRNIQGHARQRQAAATPGRHFYPALFIKADSDPSADLKTLGAGSNYYIAVLSPYGLTPMVTIEIQRSPEVVVRNVVEILERLVDAWR